MNNMGDNMVYLGLCVRYEPPIIGIHYKNKQSDQKKKVYTILLQKLVLNPNPYQAAKQLYLQHPHILRQQKIPVKKIAQLIQKIQQQLHIGEDYQQDQDFQDPSQQAQQHQQYQEEKKPIKQFKKNKFQFPEKDYDDGPANQSF